VADHDLGGAPVSASVLPDLTGLDRSFDYLVPDELIARVRVGSMVRVPLAGRRVGGWVLRVGPHDEAASGVRVDQLAPIARWSGHGPSAAVLDLARWAAPRWGTLRLRPFLVAASPARAVPSLPRWTTTDRARRTADAADVGATRLLADGGGVLRVPPDDDSVAVVLAAAVLGTALVVAPHVDRARHLAAALRGRGLSVAVLPDQWVGPGAAPDVVIGGRNAAWSSCTPASIVVLDEHDEALQSERMPTWHARDVVLERGRREGIPVLLVSPCPTVTALAWSGRRWVRPAASVERDGWPRVEVIDRSDEEPWKRSLVSSQLIGVLRDPALRVVCVHNAPGRARLLACRRCRSLLVCEHCAASVQQGDDGALACRRCGTTRPPVCQQCASTALANVRPGVTRLRDELEAAAGRAVDAVTASSGEPDPLVHVHVGTEAVLHRVPEADVVVFVDLDSELLAPRYRAAEQAFALLVRAARLLGPRRRGGRLLVQTFLPHHEVVEAAVFSDPGRVARAEAGRRRVLGLPPFGALAVLEGDDAEQLARASGLAAAPTTGGWLVRADSWDELGTRLAHAPRTRGDDVRIEVDPARR
jgi:primosomal protein N' (replication factor Y)